MILRLLRLQCLFIASALALAACSHASRLPDTEAHLHAADNRPRPLGQVPDIIPDLLLVPDVSDTPQVRYSVSVHDVPLRDLLFALARDAQLDLDIHTEVTGRVSLNAVDQPLAQILERLASQHDLVIQQYGSRFQVRPDTPVVRQYRVDYLNMRRDIASTVSSSTQIAAPGARNEAGGASSAGGGSLSSVRIDNVTAHHFWESLEQAIRDLLQETDKPLAAGSSETEIQTQENRQVTGTLFPPGSNARSSMTRPATAVDGQNSQKGTASQRIRRSTVREANEVIPHPESGLISVRATQRQHAEVARLIHQIVASATRQVLIEATIVEVTLADGYRQGIDWSRLRSDGSGFALTRPDNGPTGDAADKAFSFVLHQLDKPLNLVAAIDLLESFGQTRVLSSPRLSVLNNQTALLKVVENLVYFNVKSDITTSANVGTTTAVTTTPQSVSVGLVMSVTPQISEVGQVILNVRPSISSVSDWKQDPNPVNVVPNFVPQIRTREIESVMRIATGDIAVLGGLMEDRDERATNRVPGLSQIPALGELLTRRDLAARKAELVILLRPILIEQASLAGDFASQRPRLPGLHFFRSSGNPS